MIPCRGTEFNSVDALQRSALQRDAPVCSVCKHWHENGGECLGTTRIYIIAGNAQQADAWRKSGEAIKGNWPIGRSQAIYVSNPNMLLGLREIVVAYVGTWDERKDLGRIATVLQAIAHHKVLRTGREPGLNRLTGRYE